MIQNADRFDTHPDIARVVVTREEISQRVTLLAKEIAHDFAGEEITIICALTGAILFVSDLMRELENPIRIEPVSVSSYPGKSTRSRECKLRLGVSEKLCGKNVLLVDDIYDSGQTAAFIESFVMEHKPAKLRSCMLLRKDRPDIPNRPGRCDYFGFDIPDEFVVGYGLDFDGLYRNLPFIGVLAEHARN